MLIVDHHLRIEWVKCFGLLEVFRGLAVVFEGFVTEGSSEMSVGILGVLIDHFIEVFYGLIVLLDQLVCLGPLVDIFDF